MFYCPCCGYETLSEQNGWEICPVCFWEDDPVQSSNLDSDVGANDVSLRQARINYDSFGASEQRLKQHARSRLPNEPRDPQAPYTE